MPERRVHAQCSSASARVSSSQTEPGQRSYRTECGDGAPKPDTLEGHLEGCHVSVSRWASGGSRARPRLEEGDGWGRPRQGPAGACVWSCPLSPPRPRICLLRTIRCRPVPVAGCPVVLTLWHLRALGPSRRLPVQGPVAPEADHSPPASRCTFPAQISQSQGPGPPSPRLQLPPTHPHRPHPESPRARDQAPETTPRPRACWDSPKGLEGRLFALPCPAFAMGAPGKALA